YFHGFAWSPASAKITALRPLLAPHGIELNTPDLNAPSFESLDWNAIVARALDAAREHPPRAIVGSSLGGLVALEVVRRGVIARPRRRIAVHRHRSGRSRPHRVCGGDRARGDSCHPERALASRGTPFAHARGSLDSPSLRSGSLGMTGPSSALRAPSPGGRRISMKQDRLSRVTLRRDPSPRGRGWPKAG